MAKNVVIYSDGTGQAGGFRFDEDRSNVYPTPLRCLFCHINLEYNPAFRG